MFLPLVLHIPTTFHPFTSLRSPITWHTGLSRPSVSFTLSNKSGYSLFSFYPRCSQCHQSAFSKPRHKCSKRRRSQMIDVEIGAQQLCSILKHDTEKKIYNTLWVKYTKYCKNMFKLWIKKKGKKLWLECWMLSKFRKHHGGGVEQQEAIQIKQVIHEHRGVLARPDVVRLRKWLDWGGVHVPERIWTRNVVCSKQLIKNGSAELKMMRKISLHGL